MSTPPAFKALQHPSDRRRNPSPPIPAPFPLPTTPGLRVPTHPPAVPLPPPPTASEMDLKPKGGSGTTLPPPPPLPGVAGRTVAEAGLRGLDGLFLVAVQRGGDVQHAVSRDFRLEAGDVLLFAGDMSKVRPRRPGEGFTACGLGTGLGPQAKGCGLGWELR